MHVAIKQLRMHSCMCDYESRALCLRFVFVFKSHPSNHSMAEQSWEIKAAHLAAPHLWDQHQLLPTLPIAQSLRDAKPATSEPRDACWHILQWGDQHLSIHGADWEALGWREKGAAASQFTLSQTPGQKLGAGLQIK